MAAPSLIFNSYNYLLSIIDDGSVTTNLNINETMLILLTDS